MVFEREIQKRQTGQGHGSNWPKGFVKTTGKKEHLSNWGYSVGARETIGVIRR